MISFRPQFLLLPCGLHSYIAMVIEFWIFLEPLLIHSKPQDPFAIPRQQRKRFLFWVAAENRRRTVTLRFALFSFPFKNGLI
jgi:hypothetical protein